MSERESGSVARAPLPLLRPRALLRWLLRCAKMALSDMFITVSRGSNCTQALMKEGA